MDELLQRKKKTELPDCDSDIDLADKFSEYFVDKISKIRKNLDLNSPKSPEITSKHVVKNTSASVTSFTPATISESRKIIGKSASTLLVQNLAISNLTYLSKIIERVVASRLFTHMNENNIAEPMQSAYRPGHTTETALLHVHNNILRAVDEQKAVALVLLDLSAAFDTIDHNIMLSRLSKRLGVGGIALKWFESYLKGRKQSVVINETLSSPVDVLYGVPQGSVLGHCP